MQVGQEDSHTVRFHVRHGHGSFTSALSLHVDNVQQGFSTVADPRRKVSLASLLLNIQGEIANKCTKFYAKRLGPSKNIVESRRGGLLFWLTLYIEQCNRSHAVGHSINLQYTDVDYEFSYCVYHCGDPFCEWHLQTHWVHRRQAEKPRFTTQNSSRCISALRVSCKCIRFLQTRWLRVEHHTMMTDENSQRRHMRWTGDVLDGIRNTVKPLILAFFFLLNYLKYSTLNYSSNI